MASVRVLGLCPFRLAPRFPLGSFFCPVCALWVARWCSRMGQGAECDCRRFLVGCGSSRCVLSLGFFLGSFGLGLRIVESSTVGGGYISIRGRAVRVLRHTPSPIIRARGVWALPPHSLRWDFFWKKWCCGAWGEVGIGIWILCNCGVWELGRNYGENQGNLLTTRLKV